MAQAVEFRTFTPDNSREDLMRRIHEAPAEHADALLAAFALLQKFHDVGLLSLASGLISAGNTIVNHLAAVADTQNCGQGIRVIRHTGVERGRGIQPAAASFQLLFERRKYTSAPVARGNDGQSVLVAVRQNAVSHQSRFIFG